MTNTSILEKPVLINRREIQESLRKQVKDTQHMEKIVQGEPVE